MPQGQSRATAIAGAFALIPSLVRVFRGSNTPGMTNAQRHQNTFDVVAAALQIAGVAVGANNPALAPLINQTISATVDELKADGTIAQPANPAPSTTPTAATPTAPPATAPAEATQNP